MQYRAYVGSALLIGLLVSIFLYREAEVVTVVEEDASKATDLANDRHQNSQKGSRLDPPQREQEPNHQEAKKTASNEKSASEISDKDENLDPNDFQRETLALQKKITIALKEFSHSEIKLTQSNCEEFTCRYVFNTTKDPFKASEEIDERFKGGDLFYKRNIKQTKKTIENNRIEIEIEFYQDLLEFEELQEIEDERQPAAQEKIRLAQSKLKVELKDKDLQERLKLVFPEFIDLSVQDALIPAPENIEALCKDENCTLKVRYAETLDQLLFEDAMSYVALFFSEQLGPGGATFLEYSGERPLIEGTLKFEKKAGKF